MTDPWHMREQEIVKLVMEVLGCSEQHARVVCMFQMEGLGVTRPLGDALDIDTPELPAPPWPGTAIA